MNNSRKNRIFDQMFKYWGIFCTLLGLVLLAIFIGSILVDGLQRIDWDFITSLPSRSAERAGIYTALMGQHLDPCSHCPDSPTIGDCSCHLSRGVRPQKQACLHSRGEYFQSCRSSFNYLRATRA